uniref:Ubiquitin-like domain-containing protein n=1 Tax=Heterorhabditis bacteriophora TaxID=37862 RepID=A0A1I7WU67_HETBA
MIPICAAVHSHSTYGDVQGKIAMDLKSNTIDISKQNLTKVKQKITKNTYIMSQAAQELKLNVTYFYKDEESRQLITAEEAAQLNSGESDNEYFMRGEKVYECVSHIYIYIFIFFKLVNIYPGRHKGRGCRGDQLAPLSHWRLDPQKT